MAIDDIKNFVPVSTDLATAGQPSEPQLQEIAQAGFDVVINLGLLDPRYCLPDEAGLAGSLGMLYQHIPVDFNAPQFEDLEKFFEVMDASHGKKVFVHCAANYRVSGFLSLYGEARLGWSPAQAIAHVRRVWEPNDTWKAFLEESRRKLQHTPLSAVLPGTWRLVSRIDLSASGERKPEPSLGEDPIALLIYDRAGHFAAQFMRRDRSTLVPDGPAAGTNNSRAQGGYDAYFGTYTVDDQNGTVTQHLLGSLSQENVGMVLTRAMQVAGDRLIIKLATTASDGTAVTRTLTWQRVG